MIIISFQHYSNRFSHCQLILRTIWKLLVWKTFRIQFFICSQVIEGTIYKLFSIYSTKKSTLFRFVVLISLAIKDVVVSVVDVSSHVLNVCFLMFAVIHCCWRISSISISPFIFLHLTFSILAAIFMTKKSISYLRLFTYW